MRPVHLNTAGAGLPAPGVLAAMAGHLALEAKIGPYEAEARRATELECTVYARIAELIGARPDEVALFGSATDAWCRTVCQLRIPRGSRLWVTRYEYAGNLIALQRVARARDCELEVIPCRPDGAPDLDWMRASLDDRVALVSVVHMPSGAGVEVPVHEVGALLAAGSRALYIVDACQTVGQLPIDVRVIGCHALTGAGRKFLRGPRGSGFAYLRADLREQVDASWYDLHAAHAESLHEHRVTAQGATRFETAERSNAVILGLLAAAEFTLQGPGGPAADVRAALLDAIMTAPGVRLLAPRPVPAAIASFVHERFPAGRVVAGLAADGITAWVAHGAHTPLYLAQDGVSEFVRTSVHHYTSLADIELFRRSLHRFAKEA
ncbi:MAG TPA: aminotransferase class V-fold PLP-dependent enzyme [Trebonia sp.]|jgi:selenocysteine lyase/cysteine desulfurase|nr:aminotransferase class V-fold PLP-dependent enzyme [Trebonia sp.]